ncbi:thiamine pyrophosphate-dependent enzyme [Lipingzhangella rawalii]|nr:thiamine pyrophosphate-dependent enzyme [Lipingzhangella rawalii]
MRKSTVADVLWDMLHAAGVRRCYGIVGDALNPVIDALARDGRIDFVHVRHEEAGVFAAVADAYLTGAPVVVCGTAGPGATHLLNGLMDARKEGAPVIALAGDTVTDALETETLEEVNPHQLFQTASLYTGQIVNPRQTHAVVQRALLTALRDRGPTVISLPGDVAAAPASHAAVPAARLSDTVLRPAEADLRVLADMLNEARTVTIFGGEGCRDAHDQVVALAERLQAPVAYTLRGKQWLEWDNPNAVGMTGLLGWGGAHQAMYDCDMCLLLGTDFPFSAFLPGGPRKAQVDRRAANIGRRTPVDLGLVGHVGDTIDALLPLVHGKTETKHLDTARKHTTSARERNRHYVDHGPTTSPIRPEYLTTLLDERAADDAVFTVDTGTACIWAARHLTATPDRRILGSFSWASMANAMPNALGAALAGGANRQVIALCGDGGFTMLLGDLLTLVQRKLPVKIVVLNNSSLGFVHIEMEEAGLAPYGTELANPNFAKVAEAMGATGMRVSEPLDVSGAVDQLLDSDGPAVLDAVVDPVALALPPQVSFGMAEGFGLSLAKQALHGNLDDAVRSVTHNVRLL